MNFRYPYSLDNFHDSRLHKLCHKSLPYHFLSQKNCQKWFQKYYIYSYNLIDYIQSFFFTNSKFFFACSSEPLNVSTQSISALLKNFKKKMADIPS